MPRPVETGARDQTDGLLTVFSARQEIQPYVNALPFTFPGDTEPRLLTVQRIDTHRTSTTYVLRDPDTNALYFGKRYTIGPDEIDFQDIRRRASVREKKIGQMLTGIDGLVPLIGYVAKPGTYTDINSSWYKTFILISEYSPHLVEYAAENRMVTHPQWAIQRVIIPLLGILSKVHERGVFHADIKPSNILVRYDGNPRPIDFGISGFRLEKTYASYQKDLKALYPTYTAGTLDYIDPRLLYETTNSNLPNYTGDLYSVGKMLYWILGNSPPMTEYKHVAQLTTGSEEYSRVPIDAKQIRRILEQTVPKLLVKIVMNAISYNFSSASEMQNALSAAIQDREVASWLQNQESIRNQPSLPSKPTVLIIPPGEHRAGNP